MQSLNRIEGRRVLSKARACLDVQSHAWSARRIKLCRQYCVPADTTAFLY